MSISALLLGLIDIAILAAVLILVGLVIVWVAGLLGYPIPANIQKVGGAIIGLIVLYHLVALIFGLPRIRIIGSNEPAQYSRIEPTRAQIANPPSIMSAPR